MDATTQLYPEARGEFLHAGEYEVLDDDILCAEPADEARPSVRMSYDQINAFLGDYLGSIRRGKTVVVPAPESIGAGELLDVEIAIADLERVVLHAQVLGRWPLDGSQLAEVQFVAGRMTDRIVAPLAEKALGSRLAQRMFRA